MGRAVVQKQQVKMVSALPDAQSTLVTTFLLAVITFCGTQYATDFISGPKMVILGGFLSSLVYLMTFLALGNFYVVIWGNSTPSTWFVVSVAFIASQFCAIGVAPQACIISLLCSAAWTFYLVCVLHSHCRVIFYFLNENIKQVSVSNRIY